MCRAAQVSEKIYPIICWKLKPMKLETQRGYKGRIVGLSWAQNCRAMLIRGTETFSIAEQSRPGQRNVESGEKSLLLLAEYLRPVDHDGVSSV